MTKNSAFILAASLAVALGLALFLGAVLFLGLLPGSTVDPVRYRVVDLGMGETPTCAVSINDQGQILLWECRHYTHVISYGGRPSKMTAWVRAPGGDLREIPGLGGDWVLPREINNRGAVLGEAGIPYGKPHGFIWDGSEEPLDLGELGFNLPYAEVHGWDDSGKMGGMYYRPKSYKGRIAFNEVPRIWEPNGEVSSEFEEGSRVADLNNRGMALVDGGRSWSGSVVTATGEEISLGELAHQGSHPLGINDPGEVVGYSSITSTFQGTVDGIWGAVKRRKASIQWEERPHAFLWKKGEMIDLNTLIGPGEGWELLWAYAINDRGQIVGGGRKGGSVRAFLLEPNRDR